MAKRKAKPNRIYATLRHIVDRATGERVLVLVPRFASCQRLLAEKGFKAGDDIRVDVSKPRILSQWRKIHLLADLVRTHIDGFEGLSAHEAIKRLQTESGQCCDSELFQVPGLGTITRVTPQSLAFDEMDEGAFNEFYKALCCFIAERYWQGLTPEQVEAQAELMTSNTV